MAGRMPFFLIIRFQPVHMILRLYLISGLDHNANFPPSQVVDGVEIKP